MSEYYVVIYRRDFYRGVIKPWLVWGYRCDLAWIAIGGNLHPEPNECFWIVPCTLDPTVD